MVELHLEVEERTAFQRVSDAVPSFRAPFVLREFHLNWRNWTPWVTFSSNRIRVVRESLMSSSSAKDPAKPQLTVLCLASYFKGLDFIRECRRQGCSRTVAYLSQPA